MRISNIFTFDAIKKQKIWEANTDIFEFSTLLCCINNNRKLRKQFEKRNKKDLKTLSLEHCVTQRTIK